MSGRYVESGDHGKAAPGAIREPWPTCDPRISRAYDFPDESEARQAWKEPANIWGLREIRSEALDDASDVMGHGRHRGQADAILAKPDADGEIALHAHFGVWARAGVLHGHDLDGL